MGMILGEQKAGIEIGAILAISSAVPDHNKNHSMSSSPFWNPEEKRRGRLTDANRGEIVKRFLDGESDWIFMIDDDTVPPKGVISHLMGLGRELVGGVYYNTKPPYNPIAYYRREDGLYSAVYDYIHGSMLQVDSIGMGCTLIHRSVFEKIMAGHTLFQRPNGSLMVVPNEKIGLSESFWQEPMNGNEVVWDDGGDYVWYLQKLVPLEDISDNRAWPFYALEYGRTEDHHFCELADNVGIKPYLDTAVTCEHWKPGKTTRAHYKRAAMGVQR